MNEYTDPAFNYCSTLVLVLLLLVDQQLCELLDRYNPALDIYTALGVRIAKYVKLTVNNNLLEMLP